LALFNTIYFKELDFTLIAVNSHVKAGLFSELKLLIRDKITLLQK